MSGRVVFLLFAAIVIGFFINIKEHRFLFNIYIKQQQPKKKILVDSRIFQKVRQTSQETIAILNINNTTNSPSSERTNRRIEKEKKPMGDGCYHVFLDVGSNRGVHGRFLFEGVKKYPKSKFAEKFDDIFGLNRVKQNICVFAFEPNFQKHNSSQIKTQTIYNEMGWRYYYMPYGVSDQEGDIIFYRNLDYFNGMKREEWGFSTHLYGSMNISQIIHVKTIDFATWVEKHIFDRTIPPKNKYNRHHPIVAMKMDIEGSEYQTIDHLINVGTI